MPMIIFHLSSSKNFSEQCKAFSELKHRSVYDIIYNEMDNNIYQKLVIK